MVEQDVRRALALYGYSVADVMPCQTGYRNRSFPIRLGNGDMVNLLLYKDEPEICKTIQNANRISSYVADGGLPARQLYDSRTLVFKSALKQQYACLYTYLRGETIPWEAYSMEHIKQLGASMGAMHQILGNSNSSNLPSVAQQYEKRVVRMEDYFSDAGVKHAMREKLQLSLSYPMFREFIAVLKACDTFPEQHTLHMDFVRGNILFDSQPGKLQITGILDFEKTARGIPLFDLARTLAFLHVDCKFKSPEQVMRYFIRSGYIKRAQGNIQDYRVRLPSADSTLLQELIRLFYLYDFYKFLLHNPYEFLKDNEHFTRTVTYLVKTGTLNRLMNVDRSPEN